jgi:hypothetical protein
MKPRIYEALVESSSLRLIERSEGFYLERAMEDSTGLRWEPQEFFPRHRLNETNVRLLFKSNNRNREI